jgi:hypothetical protein
MRNKTRSRILGEQKKTKTDLFFEYKLVPNLLLEKELGAGGGSRARDFWAPNLGDCSPDHESGAITRLGYPGLLFFAILIYNIELRFSGFPLQRIGKVSWLMLTATLRVL